MKKTIVALLSVMALLVFTAPSFALHQTTTTEYTPGMVKAGASQIELGGSIRIRGEVNANTSDFDDEAQDNKQGYDERVRLGLKAMVSKNTMGYVELESGDGEDIVTGGGDLFVWGSPGSEFTSGHKRDTMSIRQAYIAHQGSGLLGTMSGVKAGHMLLALGNNLFFDHTKFGDDAIILWTTVAGGELAYIHIKFDEGTSPNQNDDLDGHIITYGTALNGINLSGDVTYLRDHDKAFADGTSVWNIGLRGDAAVSGVKVKADVEIQTGKIKDILGSGEDAKFKGYSFMLGAQANVGPAAVRLNGAYGSGDDDDDNDIESFVNFLSDQQYYTYVYEYKAVTPMGTKHTGVSNTWYINLGASADATPDLKVSGDAYLLRAAKKVSDVEDSKNIGWELDGKAEYKIDNNLVYYVEGGYLFAGDAYKNITGGDDPDNAWGVRHGILLSF